MRTSLIETAQIENWLQHHEDVQNRLVMEAKILSNSKLREKAQWQSVTYELVHLYGQKKLRKEIKVIEHQLFHTSKYRSFQHRIRSIFKR